MFLHFLTELKDIFPGYQWLDVFIASKDERYNVHIIYPFPISILESMATAPLANGGAMWHMVVGLEFLATLARKWKCCKCKCFHHY